MEAEVLMEIIDLRLHDHRFWCGSHTSCVDIVRVDIELDARILMSSVPLDLGWRKIDSSLLSVIPRDVGDMLLNWNESYDASASEYLFGWKVCGDELFRQAGKYFVRNSGGKSDIAIASYWLGEAGSVFMDVRYVILQCDSIITTEDALDHSWNSLKIVPVVPLSERDTYLETPDAFPM